MPTAAPLPFFSAAGAAASCGTATGGAIGAAACGCSKVCGKAAGAAAGAGARAAGGATSAVGSLPVVAGAGGGVRIEVGRWPSSPISSRNCATVWVRASGRTASAWSTAARKGAL